MQEIVTYIIVGGAFFYALYKSSKLLVVRKKTDPYCEDIKCDGCSFKDGCHSKEETTVIS
ncbi:MAG: hypothetical protein HRT72_13730 [Flavobacteriales bacterium]|nr:hypothetical protein [Flavobacteriales bacterium]